MTGDGATPIEHLEYDSRLAKPNSLFFAVKGFQRDGYDFVPQARDNGAVAVMGERESFDRIANHVQVADIRSSMARTAAHFYGYPGRQLRASGVTGTNGKTTVCYLLRRILQEAARPTGLITSLVYDTGEDQYKADRTTPESLDIQRLLFLMLRHGCSDVVLEVSSHALMLNRVDHVDFKTAIYTNLTRDHLDFHKTMQAYAQAKFRLAHRLEGPLSYAVINLDVEEFRPLFGELEVPTMAYSLTDREADIYCGDFSLRPSGTTLDLVTPVGTRTITLRLPGRFNLINALAAAGGGLAAGAGLDNVVAGLESARPVPGRLNTVYAGQPFAVYIDYAHTPDALVRLCETVREIVDGKVYLLFGCGGDRDRGKRPLMGKAAVEGSDFAVLTSDNPRSEDPEAIIQDVLPGLKGHNHDILIDRHEAIARVLKLAGPGDAVLLAGKGAEDYQEIKGERFPFSDRNEAVTILKSMGYGKAVDGAR